MSSPPTVPVVFVQDTPRPIEDSEEKFPLIDLVGDGTSYRGLVSYLEQHAHHIQADGVGGIGHALLVACAARNYQALALFEEIYPAKFGEISPHGEYGLGVALLQEIGYLNSAYARDEEEIDFGFLYALLAHSKVHLVDRGAIPLAPDLATLLFHAFDDPYEEDALILNLLQSPLIHFLEPNGPFGLGRVLAYAAMCSPTLEYVTTILKLPAVDKIRSDIINATIELDDMVLNQFGFTEAIFLSIFNTELSEQDTASLINAIASLAPKSLYTEGSFGLQSTLALAEQSDYPIVVECLSKLIEEIKR